MNGWADPTFCMRYSLSGFSYGPWSTGQVLYKTDPGTWPYTYGGHAYPGYDVSDKTLVLSWMNEGSYIEVAKETFA